TVYNIEEIRTRLKPETFVEDFARLLGKMEKVFRRFSQFDRPGSHQPQRVVPQRLDLDGFAASWRDNPVADPRIHPGQGISCRALPDQSISGINADPEIRYLNMRANDDAQHR